MARRKFSPTITCIGLLVGCASPTVPPQQSPCVLLTKAPSSATVEPRVGVAPGIVPPERWLVLGMFPNPTLDTPTASGVKRGGVDRDYLEPIGGEAIAIITPDVSSRFTASDAPVTVREVKTKPLGLVELDEAFIKSANHILYAYAELASDRDQSAFIHFGVDDSAKVWVNSKLVHSHYHPGRPVTRWSEEFRVDLVRGKNRVLIKVDNGWSGAGFMFEPFTPEAHETKVKERTEQVFGNEALVFADGKGFVRDEKALPEITWQNGVFAGHAIGSPDIAYSWYGPDGKPANVANELGLYTAIVSYRTKRGLTARRALPLLRTPSGFWQKLGLDKPSFAKPKFMKANEWTAVEKAAKRWVGDLVNTAPDHDPTIAILLSQQVTPSTKPQVELGAHSALVHWQQSQLDLKRKLLELGPVNRVGPTRRNSPAPILRSGTAQQAGIKPEAIAELRRIASDWAKTDNQPFVLALARHGVLFLHEAFGRVEGKTLPVEHRFYPASIGKNFAALVFAQFVDRDLLKPSRVVGEVLRSFPRSGKEAIVFRQLFDHTAGLQGHTTFSGLDNPWLEEAFAAHILPFSEVGIRYEYEGDGGNLAAKAMELIDGRAFPILQREVLFSPLGADTIDQWDCGWAASATTLDIAKVAQMLLQKGAYGNWQFFTEKTWRELLPVPLAGLYPRLSNSDEERGIGLEHSWDPEDETAAPESTERKVPKKLHTVGHGSASSSIYRVDYQHDVIMVAGRTGAPDGEAYDKYLHELVRAVDAAIND